MPVLIALQAAFALDVATAALKFFKDFFGLGFTLPKMDLVAVPDFYIGAMENWGLLTFRETALLFHPSASTLSRKQYVAILVCHEVAHQWFGNLVSIAWWDQLWLKACFLYRIDIDSKIDMCVCVLYMKKFGDSAIKGGGTLAEKFRKNMHFSKVLKHHFAST